MPKLTNVRERVHQPWRDALIRSSGYTAPIPLVEDRVSLFQIAGRSTGYSNLPSGSTLPSDQSMVVLILRVFAWFRNAILRGPWIEIGEEGRQPVSILSRNGDYSFSNAEASVIAAALGNNAVGTVEDVHRLYWQTEASCYWSFGAGEKFSLKSMPTWYFAAGGGLHGQLPNSSDLILWNNGMPSHEGVLRLGRAVLVPPRQNFKVEADLVAWDAGTGASVFGSTQGARNMLSLRDNLNAVDLIQKEISFIADGIYSRDVQ